MILWIFLFILVLVIIFLILFFNRVSICFSSPRQVYNYIETNDDFYKRFSQADFKARHIETIEEYLEKIKPEISCFTFFEKLKILYCIYCADDRIRKIHFNWYQGKKASNIPWKIGCVDGKTYEEGLPHTIKDMIIIYRHDVNNSTSEELTNLLIHENVHLYQKKYPKDTLFYLSENGFSFYKKIEESDSASNPDTDNNIYEDDSKIYKSEYNSSDPSSINDIKNNIHQEHPLEKMAYKIQNLK